MLQSSVVSGKGSFGQIQPGWIVQEDASPIAPGNQDGGLGSVSFTAERNPTESQFLSGKLILSVDMNTDGSVRLGGIQGYANSVSEHGGTVDITHTTLLSKLNADRVAPTIGWGTESGSWLLRNASTALPDNRVFVTSAATDANGNVYFGTSAGNIQKFSASGSYLTGWGNGYGGVSASGNSADGGFGGAIYGIAVDVAASALYASDTYNHRIQKFSTTGAFIAKWGALGTGTAEYNTPRQITWATATSQLWVADSNNNRVVVTDGVGTAASIIGAFGTGPGQFDHPIAIQYLLHAVDGALVAVGDATRRIQVFKASGGSMYYSFGSIGIAPDQFTGDREVFSFGSTSPTGYLLVRDSRGISAYDHEDYFDPYTYIPLPKKTAAGSVTIASFTSSYSQLVTAEQSNSGVSDGWTRRHWTNPGLSYVIQSYLYLIDSSIPNSWQASINPTVTFPSWSGNVADHLRELCAIYGIEMAEINGIAVFRDIGAATLTLDASKYDPPTRTPSTRGGSRKLRVQYATITEILPPPSLYTNDASLNPDIVTKYAASNVTDIDTGKWPDGKIYYLLKWSATDAAPGGLLIQGYWPLFANAGKTYVISARLQPSKTQRLVLGVQWPNGTTSFLGQVVVTGGTQTIVTGDVVAPAGVFGEPRLIVASATGTSYVAWAAGDTLRVWDLGFIEKKGSGTFYFDGNYQNCQWTGAPTVSRSYRWGAYVDDTITEVYNARTDDNRIFSVKSGEVLEETIETNVSLRYVTSPNVSDDIPVGTGSYFVSDGANLPITPREWEAYGGRIQATINPDNRFAIDLKITGPTRPIPGVTEPYYIANADGENRYAQLSIRGIGIRTTPHEIIIPTGADPANTATEFSETISSAFYTSLKQVYRRIGWRQALEAGPNVEVSLSVPTALLTKFGTTAGSIVRYGDMEYRVTSARIGTIKSTLTMSRYFTVGAFKTANAGVAVPELKAKWLGYSVGDVNVAGLR